MHESFLSLLSQKHSAVKTLRPLNYLYHNNSIFLQTKTIVNDANVLFFYIICITFGGNMRFLKEKWTNLNQMILNSISNRL